MIVAGLLKSSTEVDNNQSGYKKSIAGTCESGDGFGGEKNLFIYMEFYPSEQILSSANC